MLSDDPWMLRVKTTGYHIHYCMIDPNSSQIPLTWHQESPAYMKINITKAIWDGYVIFSNLVTLKT